MHLGQTAEENNQANQFINDNIDEDEKNLSNAISETELSKRCKNKLEKMGIETISDLVSKTEAELLEQQGFKQAYVDEIKNQLDKLGLTLYSGNDED